jgi:hypothetical protein
MSLAARWISSPLPYQLGLALLIPNLLKVGLACSEPYNTANAPAGLHDPYSRTECFILAVLGVAVNRSFVNIHVLPRARRNISPSLITPFITPFKDTSVAYVIGVRELTRSAYIIS